MTRIVLNVATL
ncbi:Protein of unknown function [Escherichia coli D6-113.11]|nr:Protein of unknown function [Escherichia coli D6-113.11]CDU32688.1 Protein of unknown function [Escherichia coli D6-113.11]